MILIKTFPF